MTASASVDTATPSREECSAEEAMSEQQCADFEEQQQQLRASMRDLSLHISLKEELVRELARSEQASRSAVSSYRARLDEMSAEISKLQAELATTRGEMEQAERQVGRSEGEKQRLRAQYERRLKQRHSREITNVTDNSSNFIEFQFIRPQDDE